MVYVIGIIVLLLVICIAILFFKYTKLKDISESIDICAASIDSALENKHKLVKELLKQINNEDITKKFTYNKDDSIYDRENALFDVSFELNKYIKDLKLTKGKKKNSIITDELLANIKQLNEMEEDIDGLKDFYNTNVLNYNEVFLKKNYHKIFELLKLPSYKSFKIRKLEEYEIFKN